MKIVKLVNSYVLRRYDFIVAYNYCYMLIAVVLYRVLNPRAPTHRHKQAKKNWLQPLLRS